MEAIFWQKLSYLYEGIYSIRAFFLGAITSASILSVLLHIFALTGQGQSPMCHCDCGQRVDIRQGQVAHLQADGDAQNVDHMDNVLHPAGSRGGPRVHYHHTYNERLKLKAADEEEEGESKPTHTHGEKRTKSGMTVVDHWKKQRTIVTSERKDDHPLVRKSVLYNHDEPVRLPQEPGPTKRSKLSMDEDAKLYETVTKPPGYSEDYKHPRAPRRPRVLCMIFTTYDNWGFKGIVVNKTWARRCDHAEFFYSHTPGDRKIPGAIGLQVGEGREKLTEKVMTALEMMHERHGTAFDWFLKADDDSFYIIENLRYYLRRYDARQPHYVGRTIFTLLPRGYNSGGAGYVLSHAAVRALIKQGLHGRANCSRNGTSTEDYDVGHCLSKLNIYPEDTTDKSNRLRFHSDDPISLLSGNRRMVTAYRFEYAGMGYGNRHGDKILSQRAVSFHYINPAHMFIYDFLLYGLDRCSWRYGTCKTLQEITGNV